MKSVQKFLELQTQPSFKIIWQPQNDWAWFNKLYEYCYCCPFSPNMF